MKKIDEDTITKYKEVLSEEQLSESSAYPEIDIIREISTLREKDNDKINQEELDKMQINMEFLGLDLSQIPSKNLYDFKVLIIPVLYVLTSIISMKITTSTQNNKKVKMLEDENKTKEKDDENIDMTEMMNQMNKNMSMTFPIMYLLVALFAPLGLALYWLINSILMIGERLILNKFIKDEEN